MSIAFGTKTLSLKVNDPNFENFVGAVIEKKTMIMTTKFCRFDDQV